MTDFQRLKIEIYAYRRIVEKAEFFASVGECIDDVVTGQRGDGDWFGEVQEFFNDVRSVWKTMAEREAESAVRLNHDSPERYLADVQPGHIGNMGLVEVLTLLRKATAAEPQIEEYNWTCPGDQPQKPDPQRDQRFIDAYQKGLVLPALRRLNDLLEITPSDIEAVLSLKPIIDSLSVEEFRSWNGWEPMDLPEGGQALHIPYPNYHPVVEKWWNLLYQTPFYIDPYAALPEDPTPDGVPFSVMGAHFPPEYFDNATLDQVRRYMLLCTRGEKFCDGHIAGEFESGVIQAAFARLASLLGEDDSIRDWVPTTLGELGKVFGGGTPSTAKPEYWGGPHAWLTPSDVTACKTLRIRKTARTLTESGLASCAATLLPPHSVLMTSRATIGSVVINEVPMATNQGFICTVPDRDKVDPVFLAHWLTQNKKELLERSSGSTFLELSRSNYKAIPIQLPALRTQLGVVRTLEAIQAARLARLREIELERERKAALMTHLFAYGTQNEPRRDTPLGPMPDSWEAVPMGKVCKFLSGGTPSKSRPDFWQGPIPWVSGKDLKHPRLNDVTDHISVEGASVGSKMAPAHSILILVRGMGLAKDIPMSQIARPMAFNQDLKAICPPDEATGDYLYWALQQVKPDFERHIGMAAHGTRKIAGSVLDNLLIPLPGVEERKAIADALWAAHACGIALEAEAKILDELFRATLEELMSGRLSVAPLLQEIVT